jgi:hypothetical protein
MGRTPAQRPLSAIADCFIRRLDAVGKSMHENAPNGFQRRYPRVAVSGDIWARAQSIRTAFSA